MLLIKIKSLVLGTSSLKGGQSTTATLTLTLNYTMQTDLVIPVSCPNSHVIVPATVTVLAGSNQVVFNVGTTSLTLAKTTSIQAKRQLGDPLNWFGYYASKSVALTINP